MKKLIKAKKTWIFRLEEADYFDFPETVILTGKNLDELASEYFLDFIKINYPENWKRNFKFVVQIETLERKGEEITTAYIMEYDLDPDDMWDSDCLGSYIVEER